MIENTNDSNEGCLKSLSGCLGSLFKLLVVVSISFLILWLIFVFIKWVFNVSVWLGIGMIVLFGIFGASVADDEKPEDDEKQTAEVVEATLEDDEKQTADVVEATLEDDEKQTADVVEVTPADVDKRGFKDRVPTQITNIIVFIDPRGIKDRVTNVIVSIRSDRTD